MRISSGGPSYLLEVQVLFHTLTPVFSSAAGEQAWGSGLPIEVIPLAISHIWNI